VNNPLSIVSVCRSLPNPDDPSGGVFVLNRLSAMARDAALNVVQPIPYVPLARPLPRWAGERNRTLRNLEITHAPMLYVPGVLKSADAMWLARSIHGAITRLHRSRPLDLIDAHFGYPEGAGCMQVAQRLGIPYFVTIRGFENEYVHKPGIAGQMLAAMRGAAGCISVSHSLRELAEAHGVRPERISVIHNAIDGAVFHWGDADAAKAGLGLEAGRPLIVSVGHLVSRKRHHVLIDAFARTRARSRRALLVIIGANAFETRYPGELQALAAARGVADDVQFLGNVPQADVSRWLQAADTFALGTAREGCCNAVLEALACGAPVVTTPVGDNTHFVRAGENGAIVPVDDADAFAQALDSALERTWDRREIAKRLAAEVGSWERVGARVLEFMRERLERPVHRLASA
jgi:teichuronic acid biosynthesis glycosyltransferase TuaC